MGETLKQRGQASATTLVEATQIQVGYKLSQPIRDQEGVLLLDGGMVVTETIKQQLLARKIDMVVLSQADASAMLSSNARLSKVKSRAGTSPLADCRHDEVSASLKTLVRATGIPLKSRTVPHGTQPYDRTLAEELATSFAANTRAVELAIRRIVAGATRDGSVLVEVVNESAKQMEQDLDHVLASSSQIADVKQLVQRSLRLAILGMGVGIEMELDARQVTEIGTCALVHDLGLFCLPERLRRLNEPFSGDDWEMYKRHPTLTLDGLDRINDLPPVVKHAAGQVHELCDGSGYPRRLSFDRIHLYARILGPIDAYMSLNETRRGRPAFVPHDAIGCLLHQIPIGRFDAKVVRALLHTLSLFPLGSCVRLSDGRDATVIRRSTADYAKPIVQYLRVDKPHADDDADSRDTILDLSESDIEIADVLPTPGKLEMRLDRSLMFDITWDGPDCS